MSLNDDDTLALNELCDALVEGTITAADRTRLEAWLAQSDEARRHYVRLMDQSASLTHYASEMQLEPADASHSAWRAHWPDGWQRWAKPTGWGPVVLAASVLTAIAWWIGAGRGVAPSTGAGPATPREFVAQITGQKASKWAGAHDSNPSLFVRRGERLELQAGFAEITFDSGAVVLLQGPASLAVNSAWEATLRRGVLTATVPPQAIGFRVANPAVEVIDLGTEFSMIADEQSGAADVFVLKGEIEAAPRGPGDRDTLLLRANESRRFARSRVSGADNSDEMFARFNTPVPLDRSRPRMKYAQWSFDQVNRVLRGQSSGLSTAPLELKLAADSPAARSGAHSAGLRGRALRFDGDLLAKGKFPGLSGSSPRTIAFWVKTPKDALLSDAYAMVAWQGDSQKLASRPVHISWNRNPAEGPLGAVRTDFSGGHAMGTTPLRDGQWHHVCVIFLPGDDPEAPVQVKQYVDGHLESNKVTAGERRSIGAKIESGPDTADILWLGCRLGGPGPRKERFRGEIDELFVADRGLEPGEVVRLMDGLLSADQLGPLGP